MRTVCLPATFSADLNGIATESFDDLRLAILALAALFNAIRDGIGRAAFKTYPNQPVSALQSRGLSALRERLRRFKISLYAYWVEVLGWHLKNVRPEATSVSHLTNFHPYV